MMSASCGRRSRRGSTTPTARQSSIRKSWLTRSTKPGRTKPGQPGNLRCLCLAASGKSSGKPLDLFLRDLRGSGSIFVLTRGLRASPDHRHQRTGRIGRRQLSATDHPAHAALLAGQPYVGRSAFWPAVPEPLHPDLRCPGAGRGRQRYRHRHRPATGTLKAQLRAIQVGRSGYYYIIDVTPGNVRRTDPAPYKEGQSRSTSGSTAASNWSTRCWNSSAAK